MPPDWGGQCHSPDKGDGTSQPKLQKIKQFPPEMLLSRSRLLRGADGGMVAHGMTDGADGASLHQSNAPIVPHTAAYANKLDGKAPNSLPPSPPEPLSAGGDGIVAGFPSGGLWLVAPLRGAQGGSSGRLLMLLGLPFRHESEGFSMHEQASPEASPEASLLQARRSITRGGALRRGSCSVAATGTLLPGASGNEGAFLAPRGVDSRRGFCFELFDFGCSRRGNVESTARCVALGLFLAAWGVVLVRSPTPSTARPL